MAKKKQKKEKKSILPNYKPILNALREYKSDSIVTPIFISIEVLIETAIPFVMAQMVNEMSGNSMTPIFTYGLALIIMALISLLSGVMSGKYGAKASTGLAKNIRHDLFYKIQDYSFTEIDQFSSSSLVTRMTTDVTNVQNAFQMLIRIAIRTPLMFIFAFVMAAGISLELALIFVVVIPIVVVGLVLILKKVIPLFQRIFKKYDNLNATVQENVAGIRVVKSFVREDYEKEKFHLAADEVRSDFTQAERIIALNSPLMMFAVYVSIVLISFFGAQIIIDSAGLTLNTGDLSALITYSTSILMSIMMLSMVFVMLSMSFESINRISEVLETDSSLPKNLAGLKEVKDGSIEFKNVSFSYSKTADKHALEDISFKVKSGETIGILGATGSSKSTLVNLIPRLYEATVGEVLVGNKNVKDYNLESLRDEVSVVLQKNVLFSGTIAENLRWGNKDATMEELVEACKIACIDDFIESLPGKYETKIERGGTNVSGGQKQRLTIARAILKNPKIIIFDDSTSAVDMKTDALIRKGLAEKIPNTTKIIIAQRINSVEDADKIIMLDNGQIKDIGSHKDLMKRNEVYRDIYHAQSKNKEGDE